MVFWPKKGDSPEENKETPTHSLANKPDAPKGDILNPGLQQREASAVASVAAKAQESEDAVADRFGGKVRSVLGPGTVIQGKLSFDTPVRIDGKLSGEVFSTKALIVGQSGSVNAQIEVASLIVMGKVSGKVKATERIEIFPGGEVDADIQTPSLLINEGVFNGSCQMTGASKSVSVTSQAAANKPAEKTAEPAKVDQKRPQQGVSLEGASAPTSTTVQ